MRIVLLRRIAFYTIERYRAERIRRTAEAEAKVGKRGDGAESDEEVEIERKRAEEINVKPIWRGIHSELVLEKKEREKVTQQTKKNVNKEN